MSSPMPSSLFDKYGDVWKGGNEGRPCEISPVDAKLVDGNKAIEHIIWIKIATVKSFATPFTSSHDTAIIFDRYNVS